MNEGSPRHGTLVCSYKQLVSAEAIDAVVLRAAEGGHTEVVRLLMEAPAHPARADYQMDGALLRAAEGGHTEVVRLLLSAPVHPTHADCLGGAALMEAVRRQRGRALALARQGGHVEVAKLLLRFGG
eukprot:gene12959-biopygen3895